MRKLICLLLWHKFRYDSNLERYCKRCGLKQRFSPYYWDWTYENWMTLPAIPVDAYDKRTEKNIVIIEDLQG